MRAYAYIGPFQSNFSTADFVNIIKTQGVNDFSQLPWELSEFDNIRRLFISEDKTLYLYGGREAIADALENAYNITNGKIQGRTSGSQLNLFRAQRTVARGLKSKNIFMLTVKVPDDKLTGKLRTRNIYLPENTNSKLFKDLGILAEIISKLKPLTD